MSRRIQQFALFKPNELAYGGDLLKRRNGRKAGRPLSTSRTMHLVLRSSKAVGDWSFKKWNNRNNIDAIIQRFSHKYSVRILSLANVGNHIHIHLQLTNRYTYRPFIRAITSAIATAVTGFSRWKKKASSWRFWDRRPFTRVIIGRRGYLNVKDYLLINQFESMGLSRGRARFHVAWRRSKLSKGAEKSNQYSNFVQSTS